MNRYVGAALVCLVLSWSPVRADDCGYQALTGPEVVFREVWPGGEHYGYLMWGTTPEMGKHLEYVNYVGKHGRYVGKVKDKYDIGTFTKVVLDNCETVYGHTTDGELPMGVYQILDLEIAKLLIGKNIWLNKADVARLELVTLDKEISYPAEHLERVTVTGTYLPQIGHAFGAGPFYLKVKKATGEEGYIAFNSRYYFLKDPIPAGTPARIADAIRRQSVVLGMTSAQVRLAWGPPEDINRSVGAWGVHEQWVYGRQYVYLENGKVTSFQD